MSHHALAPLRCHVLEGIRSAAPPRPFAKIGREVFAVLGESVVRVVERSGERRVVDRYSGDHGGDEGAQDPVDPSRVVVEFLWVVAQDDAKRCATDAQAGGEQREALHRLAPADRRLGSLFDSMNGHSTLHVWLKDRRGGAKQRQILTGV